MSTRLRLFSGVVLIGLLTACQDKRPQTITSLSAENPHVFAYTSGVISVADPILVAFAGEVIDASQVGQAANAQLLTFSPAIKGELTWENTSTLRFTPAEYLPAITTFQASLQVDKIKPVDQPKDKVFQFTFQTSAQHFELAIEHLRPSSATDLSQLILTGMVYTSDRAPVEALASTLSAQQGTTNLEISWDSQGDNAYMFMVKGIQRATLPTELLVKWDTKALGISERGSRKIEIPAKGVFQLMELVHFQEPDQSIRIQFSDPLLQRQDLSGLITLEGYSGDLRFAIDNNEIRVYPDQQLSGSYQLLLSPGIKNIQEVRLTQAETYPLHFAAVKPQLRLVGDGVILPATDGLIFPFEAIGLTAVDLEVFKIYHNNILQFLQSNTMRGDYDLNTVGKILRQEKITLTDLNPSGNQQRWMRYAFDLTELIDEDPRAIYQIRLGFRPEYATMVCPDPSTLSRATPTTNQEAPQSIMDGYYGIYGYYDGYEWGNRDNPCYPEYYNRDRFVSRNVIASNLGIIAKMGQDKKATAIITDLRTALPVAGAKVTFYDYQQQVIGASTTDAQGLAEVALSAVPFVCLAENGDETGYLRMQDGDALSLSRFNVDGVSLQKGLKGYLYAERGVWRPGDSVYLNFVLHDLANPLPDDYPVHLEVYDARGQLFLQRTVTQHLGQVYPLHFATPAAAPTGNWRATVRLGDARFSKTIKVETVKPNRLKIALDFGTDELSGLAPINGTVHADWLHGAPARDLRAKVEVRMQPMTTTFADYPTYVFDDPARKINNQDPRVLFDGPLDEDGNAAFSASLSATAEWPGKMQARVRTRVYEQGGDFSTDAFGLPYSPFTAYAGVEVPRNQYDEPRVEIGKQGRIRFASIDKQGKPIANRRLSVGFYRVNWRWWWDQGDDQVSNYNSTTHNMAMATSELTTTADGLAFWDIQPERWGRYLIRVCDQESGHCSGSFFYAGFPWDGNDDNSRDLVAMLNFKADKEQYEVGESVQLTIPGGKAGRALVSLETGSGILEQFWVDTREGENKITFPTRPEMSPTVYAHVTMLQAHGQANNDLPIRMYGVLPLQIDHAATVLNPQIKLPTALRPEQNFTIEVSEKERQEMYYTLAIVDEGLLGLTRFTTPNPHAAFYAREALGVKTWDVYNNVLGAYGAEFDRLLSIGGDDTGQSQEMGNTANRFPPVVRHLGPFKLEKGGKNKHSVRLPNYIGAVRVMVVASSPGAYGAIEKSVPVKNPIMLLATLPRTLSPGDEIQVPVNVFVTDDNIREVQVNLKETSGLGEIQTSASQTIRFSEPGDQVVVFPVKIVDGIGRANFQIEAKAGTEQASQTIELQVRNPNPYQTEVVQQVVNPGSSWSDQFTPFGMQGSNRALLEVSSIPPLDLGRRLDYLLQYPYGCLEQTVSTGFPQLYLNKLLELTAEQQATIPQQINATIRRIQQFQTSTGGLSYWPGADSPHQWASSYATHFLLEAKAMGYLVPEALLKNVLRFQKQAARLWSPKQAAYGFYSADHQALMQAYRLYTLALAGAPDLSAMNRLRESEGLPLAARWRLAAAYALAGKSRIAQDLVANASTQVTEYQERSNTFGSAIRDQAMILETLILLEADEQAAQLVQELSKALSGASWLSTQTTAYSLLAIGKFVGITTPRADFNFTLDYRGKTNAIHSEKPVFQVQLEDWTFGDNPLKVQNQSNARLFVRLILSGQARPGKEQAQERDLALTVNYLHPDGRPLDPGRLVQGQDFIAAVTVTHPGSRAMGYQELALAQVFPAGWEIVNVRMDGLATAASDDYDYQDVRDDGVYTFFQLNRGQSRTYRVHLTAAYQGRYYLPAQSCAAMYDQEIAASTAGQWIEVIAPENR